MSEECGACGCAGKPEGNVARFCPQCSCQSHAVNAEVLENILQPEIAATYKGEAPNLCLNPACKVCYFDSSTGEIFANDDCKTGVWFKDDAKNSYICYCEKISEREIIAAVVETGLNDLGSVMLYLRENIGDSCTEKHPAAFSCNRYFQDTIEKALIVREALTNYRQLEPDSKEIPYQLIEERYNKYRSAQNMVEAGDMGGSCCGGGCGCA